MFLFLRKIATALLSNLDQLLRAGQIVGKVKISLDILSSIKGRSLVQTTYLFSFLTFIYVAALPSLQQAMDRSAPGRVVN
jgi:hypothetical protein